MRVALFQASSESMLTARFSLPSTCFIEAGHDIEKMNGIISSANCTAVTYAFTSRTIYTFPIAHIIGLDIMRRFPDFLLRHDDIITSLHEALVNALIHGNFNLKERVNMAEITPGAPELGKRIVIQAFMSFNGLILTVADEGEGFSLPAPIHGYSDKPYGRGLTIIRAFADDVSTYPKERILQMTFNRIPALVDG